MRGQSKPKPARLRNFPTMLAQEAEKWAGIVKAAWIKVA